MTGERRWTDKSLGMDQPIHRRDFLNGVAVAIGSIGTGLNRPGPGVMQVSEGWPQDQPGYYPPLLNGLRGSHPASFENAHALRDGDFWRSHEAIVETGTFLLADVSGNLAACVYLELREARAYFGLLSVDPDHQRQGLGRELVGEVERRARDAGCGVMDILIVNIRPELAQIYGRMGYAESGTAPFPDHVHTKMPCHFVRMSKDLE